MIKTKDFVQITYTGKSSDVVFDTTDEKTAKEHNIFQPKKVYGPETICIGQGQVIKGIEKSLIGKTEGETYSVTIGPEDAFGKKSAEKIQLLPVRRFKEENIQLVPGRQVYVNDQVGIVKTVSGGRTLVDFNHPLSGKEVSYDIRIGMIVTDIKEKVDSLLQRQFKNTTVKATGTEVEIELPQKIPAEFEKLIETQIKELVPQITKITWSGKQNG